MRYRHLFQPMKIGNLEIKNRIVIPPMGVNYGDGTGVLTPREKAYFVARAKGGYGLITSPCVSVDNELCGVMSAGEMTLTNDSVNEGLREVIADVHKYGTKFMVQLIHPGRQGVSVFNDGKQPVAFSPLREASFTEMPRELTAEEIRSLITKFVKAAKKAYELGADGVELHAAHGYLLHQSMSPRANQRTDEYGGTFEKRMRFITEIINGINAIKPENGILSVRINGTDHLPDGLNNEDCIRIALYLEKIGVDVLSISNGTYSTSHTITEPAICEEADRNYFLKPIKDKLTIPVIAVNNIKRPETAEKLIEDGVVDFVGLGRPSIADPEWPNKAQCGKKTIHTCISCGNCLDTVYVTGSACSMNPYAGREYLYNEETLKKDGNGRCVVVIGGGPGGITAATTAARRGFDVTLFDSNETLGGSLLLASKGKGKNKISWSLEGMINEMHEAGVKSVLGKTIGSAEEITEMNPYAVIVATGAHPVKPPIPGLDGENVYLAHDVLKNDIRFENKRIAVIGSGMTGLETTEILAEGNNRITVYEMLDEVAKGAEASNKTAVMKYLTENGVAFKTEHKLKEVKDNVVILEDLKTGTEIKEEADAVVLSMGVRANKAVEEMLEGKVDKLITIGDCSGTGKIYQATRDALDKVWSM